jgi:hypothetical protein
MNLLTMFIVMLKRDNNFVVWRMRRGNDRCPFYVFSFLIKIIQPYSADIQE